MVFIAPRGVITIGPALLRRAADFPDWITKRMQTILVELARGSTNEHVAECLDISSATVKREMVAIARQASVRPERYELVRLAARLGLA